MTKIKTAKKALLCSIISLILCFAMLTGTTFAWFTDSVTSSANKIVAGNLDIDVSYETDEGWVSIENSESLFSKDLWEPGHTEFVVLKVENKGTLALNYKMLVSPISENGGISAKTGESFKLSDFLVFATTPPADSEPTYGDGAEGRAAARADAGETMKLNPTALTEPGYLDNQGDVQYVTLIVYMPESVGNEANYLTGTTPPSIDLGITVLATQREKESDSFGTNYDAGAVTTSEYNASPYYTYFSAVQATTTSDVNGNFTVASVLMKGGNPVATASGKTTEPESKVSMTVEKSSAAETGFTVESGHELDGYEIRVEGQTPGSLVQCDLYVGRGLEDFKFYHKGSEMALGAGSTGLTEEQYYYDAVSGRVYFAVTKFSPFQATYLATAPETGTAVTNAEELTEAVASGSDANANVNVVLATDIKVTYPEAEEDPVVTLPDNAVLNMDNSVLEIESESGKNGIKLEEGTTATIQDGVIKQDNAYGSSCPVVDANHGELTLDNMKVELPAEKTGGTCASAGSDGGVLAIRNSTISGPYAPGNTVFCGSGSTVVIENSTIIGRINVMTNGTLELRGGDYTNATFSSSTDCVMIYGGLFKQSPKNIGRIASTSIIRTNADGTYEVVSLETLEPVSVDSAAALNAALQSSGLVKLASDVALDEVVEVPDGVQLILDLNGHVITGNGAADNKSARNLRNNGTLIIRDSSAAGTGEIKNSNVGAPGKDGSYGLIDNYDKLIIESGTFTNMAHGFGSAIKNREDGSLTITGGTIRSEVDDSDADVADADADGNTGKANLLISSAGTLDISGGTFILKGTPNVPAIEIYYGNSATIKNATITSGDSPAIQVWDSYVEIENAAISGEKNALEVNGNGQVKIENSTVTGGLYAPTYIDPDGWEAYPRITIASGTFSADPEAPENCYLASGSTVTANGNGTWTVTAQ